MKLKKLLYPLLTAVLLAFFVLAVWKLNSKINSLHSSLAELQEAVAKGQENDPNSYIPNLDPQGDGWKVTQFGYLQGIQEMCYTVTTDSGLVIIDGGNSYEIPRLRNIIAMYGNKVEAWILTHPHSDHITAFLGIYSDPQGISFHHIYAPELPDIEKMASEAPWDSFVTAQAFQSMDIPELEYLHTGDTLDLLGLNWEVLSAYSDEVDELSEDLQNDGSIMFKVSGREDSMLFCADVGVSLTDHLVSRWGEHLKSDYVQMGHHGFGGPGREFYEMVAPKGAFFDAYEGLLLSDGYRSTAEKEALMKELNCAIYTFFTTPNQIILF